METSERISELTARLSRLEEDSLRTRTEFEARAANAEERAARAEALVANLHDGSGTGADTHSGPPDRITRRSALLKAAAASAGGLALGVLTRPLSAAAANGDSLIIGNTGTVTGNTRRNADRSSMSRGRKNMAAGPPARHEV